MDVAGLGGSAVKVLMGSKVFTGETERQPRANCRESLGLPVLSISPVSKESWTPWDAVCSFVLRDHYVCN